MASTHDYDVDKRNDDIQVYINGEFFHRSEAKVSVMDSGYLLGDGVWEGIRLHKGTLIHLNGHLDRLYVGAKSIAMDIGVSQNEMAEALQKSPLPSQSLCRLCLHLRRNHRPTPRHP